MTQPAPQPQPTHAQRALFQQHVTQVAEAVTTVVAAVDPRVTLMALITVTVTAAQANNLSRDELVGILAHAYDRTLATMQMLGIKPGEVPTPEAQARIKKMMDDALASAEAQGGGAPPNGG